MDVTRTRLLVLVLTTACGGASHGETTPSPSADLRAASSAPIAVQEPGGPFISSATLDGSGRATPYGVSGMDPVTAFEGPTLDPTYAFTPENPARVGGISSEQPESGEMAFLGSLYGPQGQPLYYQRIGAVHGADGILDAFYVTYEGLGETPLVLYLDPYRLEGLHVPVGLTGLSGAVP